MKRIYFAAGVAMLYLASLAWAPELTASAAGTVRCRDAALGAAGACVERTSYGATRDVAGGETRLYLPLVLRQTPAITGRVTYNGAAAAGVALNLLFYNGSSMSTAATTATAPDGSYRFAGAASLGAGQTYMVSFGPNGSDPRYVSVWYAPELNAYAAGTTAAGGDFDIANVTLLSPPDSSALNLPVSFNWQARGFAADTYRLEIFDPAPGATDAWETGDLGNTGTVTIGALPEGGSYGKIYGWYVDVFGPGGFGDSFYYREITFMAGAVGANSGAAQPDGRGTTDEQRGPAEARTLKGVSAGSHP